MGYAVHKPGRSGHSSAEFALTNSWGGAQERSEQINWTLSENYWLSWWVCHTFLTHASALSYENTWVRNALIFDFFMVNYKMKFTCCRVLSHFTGT